MCAMLLGACTASAPTRLPAPPAPDPEPTGAISATGPWHFAYAPGTHRYEVRNEATIEAVGSGVIDSLTSLTYVTYTLVPGDGGLLVSGSVDSFTITPADSIPVADPAMTFPIPFSAVMDRSGHIREFSSPDTSSCGSAAGALLGLARSLLVAAPTELHPGSEWTDTTSNSACRGDVPVTVTTVRRHLLDSAAYSTTSLRIVRQSEVEMAGTGTGALRVQTTTVQGTGEGTIELLLEPATGVFRHAVGESLTTVVFDAASRREIFRQHVRLRIRLLDPAP